MKHNEALPKLQDILKLQEGNFDVMHVFVTHFLPCVSGKTNWLSNCKTKNLELTTVSNEALTLLLLENMWDKWIDHDPKEFFGPGERDETGK